MPNRPSAEHKARLYFVLIEWFEEQVRLGALRPGDRLLPERKLGEQFGLSRTVVREALRALAARGLIESYVGRGTFVRLPAVEHLSRKLRMLREADVSHAGEALFQITASLAEMAASRCTPEALGRLRALAAQAAVADEAFLHSLGEAAQNPLLGMLARALAQVASPGGSALAQHLSVEQLVAQIAAQNAEAARQVALDGRRRA